MDVLLRDGDLVLDSAGSPRYVEGNAELLQRVLLRLTARRGGFAPCPELGSRLYQLGRERPSARQALAVQYVSEALRKESALTVQAVELSQMGEVGRLTVYLDWRGEKLTVQMPLNLGQRGLEGVEIS